MKQNFGGNFGGVLAGIWPNFGGNLAGIGGILAEICTLASEFGLLG